jgi:hypothetical protein
MNIHQLDNDKSKVLIEMDVPLLMLFACAYGNLSGRELSDMMLKWGYDNGLRSPVMRTFHKGDYEEIKKQAVQIYDEYLDSTKGIKETESDSSEW